MAVGARDLRTFPCSVTSPVVPPSRTEGRHFAYRRRELASPVPLLSSCGPDSERGSVTHAKQELRPWLSTLGSS